MSDDYRYPHSLISLPVLNVAVAPTPASAAPPAAADAATVSPAATVSTAADDAATGGSAPGLGAQELGDKLLEGKVIEALREVYDPEIPVNIYELGLIYDIHIHPDQRVSIKMTLTAPACPVAGSLPGEVEKKVEAIPEVKSAEVELVWEPAWTRDKMSEAALLTLGML